jgi:hypothetical protein
MKDQHWRKGRDGESERGQSGGTVAGGAALLMVIRLMERRRGV